MVDASPYDAKGKDGSLHLKCIVRCKSEDCAAQCRTVAVAETAHHAEIEPDNRPVAHADVAGVRVAVEESVLDNLFGVVLAESPTDLRDIDASCVQGIGLIEGDAVDVLHH